jgi:hypothetical protein
MQFVILSHKIIPGFGVKGPILSPASYDIHLVLRWISVGVDVREVMEDGSLRKLKFNDERLMEELHRKLDKQAEQRLAVKKAREEIKIEVKGNVKLMPEAKPLPKKKVKKEEPKKEIIEPKEEVKEDNIDLFIDHLEDPE